MEGGAVGQFFLKGMTPSTIPGLMWYSGFSGEDLNEKNSSAKFELK
jgi:hypothetical protein